MEYFDCSAHVTVCEANREPPLLREDSDAWRRLRREWGDLAQARLFAFARGSIWYGPCQYRSSHRPEDADPLQDIIVQHHILILLSLIVVLPVVSSAVFLSVRPSIVTVGFGSSFQLLNRGFSFRHDGGVGGGGGGGGEEAGGCGKREKEGEEAGKHALLIKPWAWRNGLPRP
jgi:hypothetical protein